MKILWHLSDNFLTHPCIYKTDVYTGKAESQENPEMSTLGLGGKVVLSLLRDVKGQNHKVFMDNYFSLIPLMEELKTKAMLASGTI